MQLPDNPLALWRPRRSKSSQQKTFEEQKRIADGQSSLSNLGSWIVGSLTSKGDEPVKKPQGYQAGVQNTAPSDNLVSFENLVKDCQVDLIEIADCSLGGNESLQAIEVQGEVIVKALIPGDSPKV